MALGRRRRRAVPARARAPASRRTASAARDAHGRARSRTRRCTRGTRRRRSSCTRRSTRAARSSRSKPWRTGGPSSRRPPAACPTRCAPARPAGSCRPGDAAALACALRTALGARRSSLQWASPAGRWSRRSSRGTARRSHAGRLRRTADRGEDRVTPIERERAHQSAGAAWLALAGVLAAGFLLRIWNLGSGHSLRGRHRRARDHDDRRAHPEVGQLQSALLRLPDRLHLRPARRRDRELPRRGDAALLEGRRAGRPLGLLPLGPLRHRRNRHGDGRPRLPGRSALGAAARCWRRPGCSRSCRCTSASRTSC